MLNLPWNFKKAPFLRESDSEKWGTMLNIHPPDIIFCNFYNCQEVTYFKSGFPADCFGTPEYSAYVCIIFRLFPAYVGDVNVSLEEWFYWTAEMEENTLFLSFVTKAVMIRCIMAYMDLNQR